MRHVLAAQTIVDNALKDCADILVGKRLPGVIIFVHGVNSVGEWYEDVEAGLCKGLNTRLRRDDAHVVHPHAVGQLRAARYRSELTPRGFIDDKLNASSFVEDDELSPVIRFRWGYRASINDKTRYGANLWLNERDAWGGGPFANGVPALADCWGEAGMSEEAFGWWTAQDLNPAPGREVYALPPRAYYAHAAYRLAHLVALVREKQPDVPITIVSHSQGTMIAIASAFVGEKELGGQGVADCYHLFNSPYNLTLSGLPRALDAGFAKALGGRVTQEARRETFARFLEIVRKRRGTQQDDALVDVLSTNATPKNGDSGCTAAGERAADRDHHGRVYNHCNPADQLISAQSLQGIGWRGITLEERKAVRGEGVLFQRVWADGETATGEAWQVGVGCKRTYHYWENHWSERARKGFMQTVPNAGVRGQPEKRLMRQFWFPPPVQLRYVWTAALSDPGRSGAQRVKSAAWAVMLLPVTVMLRYSVNAEPPPDHVIFDDGPKVDVPIVPSNPQGGRFDRGREREHEALAETDLDTGDPNDPYNAERQRRIAALRKRRDEHDVLHRSRASGDVTTEKQLRYEHNARVRMEARRTAKGDPTKKEHADMADKYDGKNAEADAFMRKHYDAKRIEWLIKGKDNNSVDHSTILCNDIHAEKVIAYDIAIGYSTIKPEDMRVLRQVADWRWVPDDPKISGESAPFAEYVRRGELDGENLELFPDYQPEKARALGIVDTRETTSTVIGGDAALVPPVVSH